MMGDIVAQRDYNMEIDGTIDNNNDNPTNQQQCFNDQTTSNCDERGNEQINVTGHGVIRMDIAHKVMLEAAVAVIPPSEEASLAFTTQGVNHIFSQQSRVVIEAIEFSVRMINFYHGSNHSYDLRIVYRDFCHNVDMVVSGGHLSTPDAFSFFPAIVISSMGMIDFVKECPAYGKVLGSFPRTLFSMEDESRFATTSSPNTRRVSVP